MWYLHLAVIESSWIAQKERDAVNSLDPLRIFAVPEKAEDEWALAIKEHIRSIEHIISVIVSKTTGLNQRVVVRECEAKTGAENSKLGTGSSTKWKRENWRGN